MVLIDGDGMIVRTISSLMPYVVDAASFVMSMFATEMQAVGVLRHSLTPRYTIGSNPKQRTFPLTPV